MAGERVEEAGKKELQVGQGCQRGACADVKGAAAQGGRLGEGRARWLSRWQVGLLGWVKGALAGFWCSSTAGGQRVRGTLSCGAKRDAGSKVRVQLLLRPRGGALTGGATRSGKQGTLRG